MENALERRMSHHREFGYHRTPESLRHKKKFSLYRKKWSNSRWLVNTIQEPFQYWIQEVDPTMSIVMNMKKTLPTKYPESLSSIYRLNTS